MTAVSQRNIMCLRTVED